ncbi:hypothetical protein DPMN_027883 [Dreissena polymorpha]|uniref:Uncharacterized protein n=1 Tax=Dreissena polymorpha TaxID=45954 RepID=A0A9D4RES7_DREPO|nr:hypothetical protein DPMN_027883 [Dreissena polymorpha]
MWTNGRRTKTNSKTSPEQSAIVQLVREINKTNFHDDWAKNVTSRKTAPPRQPCYSTDRNHFLIQLSYQGNKIVLTKFHENWTKNVTSRVLTCFHTYREKCPAHWRPCFSPIWAIFELVRDINKTNVLFNFHDDWAQIVTSSVFTGKTAPPTDRHVFQRTRTTFELDHYTCIIGTNLLTTFHEDRTKNVASRVFTRKTAPPTGGHVFQQTRTTFELNQHIIYYSGYNFELVRDIIEAQLLTKFHEDREKNVPSRKYTLSRIKTAFPPGNHVFQRTGTIFELNFYIKETNVLIKFHENWAKNVTSTVFTYFHYIHIEKNGPPTGDHVFSPIWTIFEIVREINKTNIMTNFHDDWAKIVTSRVFTRKTAPPTGGHVFQRTETTFELSQHIIKTNFDKFFPFFDLVTYFELDRDIIGTKLLTKFHEDRTINVASRVFTNKCGRTDGQTTVKDRSQKLT